MAKKTALVVGASGVVGSAAVERFLSSDDDWDVVAISRRVPEVESDRSFRHLAVDLRREAEVATAIAGLSDVTHVVFAALFEKPGLAIGWTDDDYREINGAMLRNLLGPLTADPASKLEHVSLLQGAKAYGFHLGPMPTPARESEPRHQHENFYWDQEDYVKEKAAVEGWGWTVLRPHLITGGAHGVAMNLSPVLAVYAAICRELELPFGFPGGAAAPWESTDTRIVAAALEWAATAPEAVGETFNVTNGEVFGWRDTWAEIADALGLEPAPDTPHPLSTFLPENAAAWDQAVSRFDLKPTTVEEMLGESHHLADLVFAYGQTEMPPAAFESTIKIRQAGFGDCMSTEAMWRYWFGRMMEQRLIPPRSA